MRSVSTLVPQRDQHFGNFSERRIGVPVDQRASCGLFISPWRNT